MLLDAQVTEFDGGVLVNWDVREGLCTRRHRRHVHPPGRRIAPVGRRGRRLGCAEPVRATRRATRGARGAERSHRRPSTEALHDGFFRQAQQQPDAPAVFASSGDLSYAQLRDQASAVAAALRAAGLRVGDTVAVLGPKTGEQVAAVLGFWPPAGSICRSASTSPATARSASWRPVRST